jgi:hypothetical protein
MNAVLTLLVLLVLLLLAHIFITVAILRMLFYYIIELPENVINQLDLQCNILQSECNKNDTATRPVPEK